MFLTLLSCQGYSVILRLPLWQAITNKEMNKGSLLPCLFVQKESVNGASSIVQKIITYICCKPIKMSIIPDVQEYFVQ